MKNLESELNRRILNCAKEIASYESMRECIVEMDSILEDSEKENFYPGYGETIFLDSESFQQAGNIARRLLPLVGKFDKSFNEYSGKIQLSGKTKEGTKIQITFSPGESCKLRKIVETVNVPTHTMERTTFVLDGNCHPLTQE